MSRIAVLAGCLALAAAPALGQTKAEIQKAGDQWDKAYNSGNAAALAAMYTDDAYVLPQGTEMVHGRKAIEAFWHQTMQQLSDFNCTTLDVKPLGPRAAREIGTCTFKTKAQPPQAGAIKYAVVWEKSGRGWKLLQDIWNFNK
jgi:uncharacterized protein (TIGR02246 family)